MVSSMKKVFLILAAAAMAAASCTKPELEIQKPSEGKGYYFVVNAGTESAEETASREDTQKSAGTKITVGDRQQDGDNSYYPLYWARGDKIRIFNESGASVVATADVTANDTYTKAGFKTTTGLDINSDSHRIVLAYPGQAFSKESYVNNTDNAKDSLIFVLPRTQIQVGNDNSLHLRNYFLAVGKTNVNRLDASGTKTIAINDITLHKPLSIVKVNLSTTYYQGYHLKGVKLFTSNRAISGRVAYCIKDSVATIKRKISGVYDAKTTDQLHSYSVGADFETPELFNTPKTLYFVAYPRKSNDVSGRPVDLVVYLQKVDSNGDIVETVTLPIRISEKGNVKLEAGKLTEITVSDLSPSSNDHKWFEPVETRDVLDGYAYGPQNTYVVDWHPTNTQKYTISVKARGDFTMLNHFNATHYHIYTHSNSAEDSQKYFLYIEDTDKGKAYPRADGSGSIDGETQLYPVIENEISFKVNSRRDKASDSTPGSIGCWGQLAIYHKSVFTENGNTTTRYTLLWTYMIWGRRTNAARVGAVTVNGYELMDRALGTAYPNELAARVSYGFDQDNIALFQWGRKDPFSPHNPKNGSNELFSYAGATQSNNYIMAARHPNVMMIRTVDSGLDADDCDWSHAHNNGLWGAEASGASATGGHKTIYDPCPQGWRVCDAEVVNYLYNYNGDDKIQEPPLNYTAQENAWEKDKWNTSKNDNGVSNYNGGDAVLCTPCEKYYVTSGDKIVDYEIWPYHGLIWGSYMSLVGENEKPYTSWGHRNRTDNQFTGACYWSNGYTDDYRGVCAFRCYVNEGNYLSREKNSIKTNAMAVRCQKDDTDKVNLLTKN